MRSNAEHSPAQFCPFSYVTGHSVVTRHIVKIRQLRRGYKGVCTSHVHGVAGNERRSSSLLKRREGVTRVSASSGATRFPVIASPCSPA